ncbi:hypothetical protein L6164_030900 [Bauhinia variegata]|uniref:Uncharacterized protein n=1 Tax=Bauhinia variegata TaxID=167791 RepID=A0ACB9LE52_BAUVA|nr:hypothetical protein L6164_030900 [Bauhinia variegata]
MVIKISLILVLLSILPDNFKALADVDDQNNYNNDATLSSIKFSNYLGLNAVSSSRSSGCNTQAKSSESTKRQAMLHKEEDVDADISVKPREQSVKLHLKRWPVSHGTKSKASAFDSTARDLARIQILYRRITEKKNQNTISRKGREQPVSSTASISGNLIATLKSGASLGSGEYFMDVFVGTPPRVFSMILDTGSDLNWIQCVPCHDCFEQNGPHYDPNGSSSFRHINCHDPHCQLVSSPDPPRHCNTENKTCPYFYWYGDGSNTTGDFALEKFTVNLSNPSGRQNIKQVVDIMFGCGHWNRGKFHGAAGLLGLGRGPLSFTSQLQSSYGNSFSYCLVDINSNTSTTSKLIFGENKELLNQPNVNFTSLITGKESLDDTYYYLQIKSIMVGGEVLEIPEKVWDLSSEGAGGTIIDSGTTLTFFPNPAYNIIREAFREKIKGLPIKVDNTALDLCYNASGVQEIEVPEFGILFADGAVWNFPAENYFYQYDQEGVVCLAILETPHSALSILGNYLQQNFHLVYDTNKSRLGYSPTRCAEL